MNKNFNQKIVGILIVSIILVVCISMYYINTFNSNTFTVYDETIEDKILSEGIITAEQTMVNAENDGEPLFLCEEGSMVRPYKKVATVYSGEIDEISKEKLKTLNDKIVYSEELASTNLNVTGDIASINREIISDINEIISLTNNEDYTGVYKLKNEIKVLNLKGMEVKGMTPPANSVNNIWDEINQLYKEINFSRKDYTSPTDGMFSTKISNFDSLINPETALKLTVDQYKSIVNNDVVYNTAITQNKPFFKIINNYEWYAVTVLTKEELGNLSVGDDVYIRVLNCSDDKVVGNIVYISEKRNKNDKEFVVTIKSTKNLYGVWTSGKVELEIVRNTFTGLKIPISALIKKNNEEGVYVIKDGIYKFVKTKVLYRDKNLAIIKDSSNADVPTGDKLILYDSVVINPKHTKEGSIANQ